MEQQVMLTTVDNPYDPFDDYELWHTWDSNAGYHTPGLLARFAFVSYDLHEAEVQADLERAINEIVDLNLSGMHRKVTRKRET